MSALGDMWRRWTETDRSMLRCALHSEYLASCAACVALNGVQGSPWQPDPFLTTDPVTFIDVDSGGDTSGDMALDVSGGMDTSSGFDGFDGGSSDGGGASGDW